MVGAKADKESPKGRAAETAAKEAILGNPDFVLSDPEIMQALLAPCEPTPRRVIDLRTALIERLERRLDRLKAAHRDIIDAAWDNLSSAEHVHQAVLALIEADSLEAAAAIVRDELPSILEIDAARLAWERAPGASSARRAAGARSRSKLTSLPAGFIRSRVMCPSVIDGRLLFSSQDGRPSAPGVDAVIFDADADRLASSVVILLGGAGATAQGALALGSEDPQRFCAGRNADLLRFLGEVADRRTRRFLGGAERDVCAR